jgi:uncharacterized LabA/DUF88 family protein
MIRYAIFVDGANLFGSLRKLNLQVTSYQSFYPYIFQEALKIWTRGTAIQGGNAKASSILRTYWYVVGSIDQIDIDDTKFQSVMREQFEKEVDLRKTYRALTLQNKPGIKRAELDNEVWKNFFQTIKEYYQLKKSQLEGMKKFFHGMRSDTDFVDVVECGHWKVNLFNKYVMEKGVDTQLAVDLVTLADTYDVALVISGDADSIPGINYVKRFGKQVGAVEFLRGTGNAYKTKQFSNRLGAAADFTVKIYESELIKNGLAKSIKSEGE